MSITEQQKQHAIANLTVEDPDQIIEPVGYDFGLSRRSFVQILGAGLIIAAAASSSTVLAQERQRRGGGGRRAPAPVNLDARVHIGKDGTLTVMTGKVECGQGSRAQITQAAAEELRVPADRVKLIMADTAVCPDDGFTAGSRTTPSTLPSIRQGCAAARKLLSEVAAKRWNVAPESVVVEDGVAKSGDKKLTYADLVDAPEAAESFKKTVPTDLALIAVEQWKVLGTSVARPNQRDLVTGAHQYPSDIVRPGMLYGKILRRPSFGAKLSDIDVAPAKAMDGVVVVRDDQFVGVVAPNSHVAKQAIAALQKTAKWEQAEHPSSAKLYEHLRKTAKESIASPFADEAAKAAKSLKATYHVAYVQHAPMEPRAAVAEWDNGKLTVWTATQNPPNVRRELAGAFHIPDANVRVIIPDFGGGFGGKHTGETAVEAARLAQAAGKPVALLWTREEEFTWASFRPAALIDVEASLDESGKLATWHFINVNSGGSGVEPPYRVAKNNSKSVNCEAPLRHGSYRALASTANHFARESFMDELAHLLSRDPLDFRLTHLETGRLRDVLEDAAKRFDWTKRRAAKKDGVGVGLACGAEKGSFVAACAEVTVDRAKNVIRVNRICQSYECGAITSPANLRQQVEGAIIMALGPALREASQFENGQITNASFWKYEVPRLSDVPELDLNMMNRPDLASAGAGETPIIAVAPAIANAVFHAIGVRVREMPMRLPTTATAAG